MLRYKYSVYICFCNNRVIARAHWSRAIIINSNNKDIDSFALSFVPRFLVTLMWIATFWPRTAGLHQAMVSATHVSLYVTPWLFVIGAFWPLLCLFIIGGFRSPLFWLDTVPSEFLCGTDGLLCRLIVGIHASGISIPLSILMLLGWSLTRIASFTLRVYQCGSRSINLTLSQSG